MTSPMLLLLAFFNGLPCLLASDHFFSLTDDYDKSEIPGQVLPYPLAVIASVNLRSIFEVDEVAQSVTVDTTLRFKWKDDRITVNLSALATDKDYIYVDSNVTNQIWIPDIIIDKTKSIRSPSLVKGASSIRLYKDSTIVYSSRKNYDLACGMDCRKFPFDNQTCELVIHSYGSSTKDYTLKWGLVKEVDRIVNPSATDNLPQFTMNVEFIDDWDLREYDIAAYPGVILRLELRRMLTYYSLQLFIPSGLFVTLAWATMFFPTTVAGIRAQYNVQITNLISIFTMNNGIQTIVPKTSYLTYADYWLQSCFAFIFVMIGVLVIFCALYNSQREEVISWADFLNRRSREVMPFLFILFLLFFFLVAAGVLDVE